VRTPTARMPMDTPSPAAGTSQPVPKSLAPPHGASPYVSTPGANLTLAASPNLPPSTTPTHGTHPTSVWMSTATLCLVPKPTPTTATIPTETPTLAVRVTKVRDQVSAKCSTKEHLPPTL